MWEHSLTLAAKKYGIKTLSVSDFWTGRIPYFSDQFVENGKFKFLTDKITVLDELQKKIMIEEGFPKEKVKLSIKSIKNALKSAK